LCVCCICSCTQGRRTLFRNICAVCGFDEMKMRVAANMAFGVQFSGRVMERRVSHAGIEGRILKGLGSLPDL
jgi:hypothetical protein